MQLPYLAHAEVPKEKIVNYLLSLTHRDGKHKAAFFRRFGFGAARWELLRDVLLKHAQDHDVDHAESSPFGVRWLIEGESIGPDGRSFRMRSVWFIESGSNIPRLVTAYPLQEKNND